MEEELSFCEFEWMVTLDLRREAVGFLIYYPPQKPHQFPQGGWAVSLLCDYPKLSSGLKVVSTKKEAALELLRFKIRRCY
jgi:hypothetical protein